nr:hypothetical protein [Candidatus Enterovibrio luxaltus]
MHIFTAIRREVSKDSLILFFKIAMPLSYPHYSYTSKLAQTVNVVFEAKNKGIHPTLNH